MACCCDQTAKPGSGYLLTGTIDSIGSYPASAVSAATGQESSIAQESLLGGFSSLPWWARILFAVAAIGGVAYFAHEGMKGK